MTKAQRKTRAKRAGAKRRKANAVKAFMRKMNPGKKAPVAVRVKRLKGGGISVTPLKMNRGGVAKVTRRAIVRGGKGWGAFQRLHPSHDEQLYQKLKSSRARAKRRGNIAW